MSSGPVRLFCATLSAPSVRINSVAIVCSSCAMTRVSRVLAYQWPDEDQCREECFLIGDTIMNP
jgi:hypothetical protein